MIKNLTWVTKDGNKMTLSNAPIILGIDMLLISCNREEKIKILEELNKEEEHSKICSNCICAYDAELNKCPECDNNLTL